MASYELENDEFKKKILKEAKSLKARPEGLATRGYIFQKTKSGLNTRFVARLERYKRVSESNFVGEDIYMIHSKYRCKNEEGT